MALTIIDRGTWQDAPGGGTFTLTTDVTSGSLTVAAGTILVLGINVDLQDNSGSASNEINVTVTDTIGDTGGGAWTQQAECTKGLTNGTSTNYQQHVWLFTRVIGTTPGASKTISFHNAYTAGAGTTSADGWRSAHLWEVSGQAASPIGLTASPAPLLSTSTFNTDLGGVPAADSAVFGTIYDNNQAGPAVTEPSGWTEDDEQAPAWGAISERAHINGGSVQSPQWTGFTNSASTRILGCAVEIKAAPSGQSGEPVPPILGPGAISPFSWMWQQQHGVDAVTTQVTNANALDADFTFTAYQASPSVAVNAGVAALTFTGNNASAAVKPNAGVASWTFTTNNPTSSVSVQAGVATFTFTANNASETIAQTAGVAAWTFTANNATVSTGTNANAGNAAWTFTANNASENVSVNAGVASWTFTANNATVSTSSNTQANAGNAAWTFTANNPGETVKVNAGVASWTFTGNNAQAVPGISAAAGVASYAFAAQQAKTFIAVMAGVAAWTITANNATVPSQYIPDVSPDIITGRELGPISGSEQAGIYGREPRI